MTGISAAISNDQSIYAALELSKNSWLLAIQVPVRDNPSLYPIRGGNAEGVMAKLDAARDRAAKVTGQAPKVTLCYEAGYDGFWLARFSAPNRRPSLTPSWPGCARTYGLSRALTSRLTK